MMMLHQDRRKKNKKIKIFLILIVIFTYVLFISPVSSTFTGYFHRVAQPFWKINVKIQDWLSPSLSYFSSRRELYVENQDLKKQIEVISARLADRSFLLHENTLLKENLGRHEKEPKRVFAVVLAKPDITPYDTLVLDVGRDNMVSVGDLVLVENVVLGEIEEVYQISSKARLYSSNNQKTNVFIGDNAIGAEAQGLGGGNFEIELPRNVDVFVGDSIYVSDINPRVLGTIEYINSDPNDVFERILFKSPVNPFSLRFVDVIHTPHE